MQTTLSQRAKGLTRADDAERILRSCVHCGFCNATCPTYQLLGDELDGPRGRIYQIKEVLEGKPASPLTQLHLDRCLACSSCETTCPSGVEYHTLLDIGRAVVDEQVTRPIGQRLLRTSLRHVVTKPRLFKVLVKIGSTLQPILPAVLQRKLPRSIPRAAKLPTTHHPRQMLMLDGCVQPAFSPNTNAAAARVLDRFGISIIPVREAVCCGAVDYHLDAQAAGLNRARRNIDAWWPAIERGAEAIVQTASGCGAFIKDYAALLKHDPAYAAKAERVSALSRDLVEILRDEPLDTLALDTRHQRLAVHCPCTLQHSQPLGGVVETVLTRLGFDLTPVADAHLCCGSAGAYSIVQPELAQQFRDDKIAALEQGKPDVIVTANVGCQTHLDSARRTPVRHWIELVDEALLPTPSAA
ncbi:glycolate oxidase iron-sulfur subunit [Cephaloticoccus capnophilus]|uniref:Glycolate oxidase iron-sulfur subunit n=1 Tax=Cephaloticoccus capnophilus TaxID=1548208 RepID=A0A139SIR5_9BACT|nr:glycolate oxidase subunit GlcF [Cephaloticoccus capnophilus]KXU34439.1 glycolate oxidase iron-sulfur subunit [Cephaloticoccus capnophilus]